MTAAPGPPGYDEMWDRVVHPTLGPMRFDRHGQPISLRRYVELMERDLRRRGRGRRFYKRVAADRVGPAWVSTVWLGNDHSFGRGRPVIFETMVFHRKLSRITLLGGDYSFHPEFGDYTYRYRTEREALRGHWAVRRLVRRELQRCNGPGSMSVKLRRNRRRAAR